MYCRMEQCYDQCPQPLAVHGIVTIQSDQSRALSVLSLQSEKSGPGKLSSTSKAGFLKLVEVVSTHLGYMCVQNWFFNWFLHYASH